MALGKATFTVELDKTGFLKALKALKETTRKYVSQMETSFKKLRVEIERVGGSLTDANKILLAQSEKQFTYMLNLSKEFRMFRRDQARRVTLAERETAILKKSNSILEYKLKNYRKLSYIFIKFFTYYHASVMLIDFLKDTVVAFDEASSKIDAVLKSTGQSAGVTKKAIMELNYELYTSSKYSREEILKVQGLLLSFTNIHKEVYADAMKAVLNLADGMDEDLATAAKQVGKALNEPVKLLNALTRIGVKFSQEQRDSIEYFMLMNDRASAQKIILKELQVEYGGTARAMRDTFGGKTQHFWNSLKVAFQDLLAMTKVTYVLANLFNSIAVTLDVIHKKGFSGLFSNVIHGWKYLIPLLKTYIEEMVVNVKATFRSTGMSIGDFFGIIFSTIKDKIKNIGSYIADVLKYNFSKVYNFLINKLARLLMKINQLAGNKYLKHLPFATDIKQVSGEAIEKVIQLRVPKEEMKIMKKNIELSKDNKKQSFTTIFYEKLADFWNKKSDEITKMNKKDAEELKKIYEKRAKLNKKISASDIETKQKGIEIPKADLSKLDELRAKKKKEEEIEKAKTLHEIFMELLETAFDWGQEIKSIFGQMRSEMSKAFQDFLGFSENIFSSLGKLMQGMLNAIANSMKRMVADYLADQATKKVFGYLQTSMGWGMKVDTPKASVKKPTAFASGGIAVKPQIATIAENGKERVLTNRQTIAFEKMVNRNFEMGSNNINVSIKNTGNEELRVKQAYTTTNEFKEMVLNVVLEAKATNPTFSRAIRS